MAGKCRHLDGGGTCWYGCTPQLTQCHRFQRRQCRHGAWCWHGAHTSFPPDQPPAAAPAAAAAAAAAPSPTMDDVFLEVQSGILKEIESTPARDRRDLRLLLLLKWHPDKWSGTGGTLTAFATRVTQFINGVQFS
jgi:hypothetical protein